jgi:hypothetical protein
VSRRRLGKPNKSAFNYSAFGQYLNLVFLTRQNWLNSFNNLIDKTIDDFFVFNCRNK